jgi:hypothetical protein
MKFEFTTMIQISSNSHKKVSNCIFCVTRMVYTPSSNILKYICLFLPNAVRVTVSHGTPICRSSVCCSLVRSTRTQVPSYLHYMKIMSNRCKVWKILMAILTQLLQKIKNMSSVTLKWQCSHKSYLEFLLSEGVKLLKTASCNWSRQPNNKSADGSPL